MVATLEDRFIVYVREKTKPGPGQPPQAKERELVSCYTYEEAQAVRRECSGPTRSCIIRYVGPAGGGD